jgi:hypothetical protein
MPGFGTLLGAELLAATGGDITAYDSAARLAGVAGLAPVPRDSGRISGNHHRPKRYDRQLLNAFYLAAQSAARYCPQSRSYYQRKRAEGKNHKQAVLSLARRRLNVLWAMLRDNTPYRQPTVQLSSPQAPPSTGLSSRHGDCRPPTTEFVGVPFGQAPSDRTLLVSVRPGS